MRFLTVTECEKFGIRGSRNEVTPCDVRDGYVHTCLVYTSGANGRRSANSIAHGSNTYGNLVAAIDENRIVPV